jgi:outer membrane receptor protein involved in Fe transport
MKKLCTLLFTLSILIAHGDGEEGHRHDRSHSAFGFIEGVIINSESGNTVEYASVSIYDLETDELIAGSITDTQGYFSIDKIPMGSFFILIQFIGYEVYRNDEIILSSITGVRQDLGEIKLNPKSIKGLEVNVTEDMPKIEFETDKLVYTPSGDILASSGSAEDLLNNVPMVLVDQDGTVTLKGSSNVKILVNNRENRIGEGGNDVDNIPASMIEKVEVITSPSAKYDPEGMAGIINIILKKDKDEGFNGEVKLYTKQNEQHDFFDMGGLSLSVNLKKNKFNIYSSYSNSLRYRDHNGYRKSFTTFTHPDTPDLENNIHFDWEREKKKRGQIFRLGTDYYLTDDITLNLESRYNNYSSSEKSTETTILPEVEHKEHEEAEPDGNYELGLSFSADKTYDNPDQNLSFSYSYDTHPVDEEYDIIVEEGHRDTTFISSTLKSQELNFSYAHPINENSKFEIGYDFDQTNNNEDMNYFLHVHREDEEHEDEDHEDPHISGLNTYGYQRDIHGGYIEYNAKLTDKWSIKPGVRFEYVNKNINFLGTPEHWYCESVEYETYEECSAQCSPEDCQLTDELSDELGAYSQILQENNNVDLDNSYTSIYPSFHITYNLSEKQSLQFAVSSRVERPGGGHHGGSRQIRPFPREVHSHQFIFLGNPELKPEYATNYELSFKSPIPMGFFYTNLYFNDVRDKIEWYSDNSYENFDVVTFDNADKAKSYGLEYFFMVMGQTIGGGFWYNDLQDGSDDSELNGVNKGLNMYGKINLPEKMIKYFGFEFGYYYMKMADDYGSMFGDKGTIWANIGITKSLFNQRIKASFDIDNIFNGGGFSMTRTKPLVSGFDYIAPGYTGGEEYTDLSSSRNGRTFSITLKYNFGELERQKRSFGRDGSMGGGGMDMGY